MAGMHCSSGIFQNNTELRLANDTHCNLRPLLMDNINGMALDIALVACANACQAIGSPFQAIHKRDSFIQRLSTHTHTSAVTCHFTWFHRLFRTQPIIIILQAKQRNLLMPCVACTDIASRCSLRSRQVHNISMLCAHGELWSQLLRHINYCYDLSFNIKRSECVFIVHRNCIHSAYSRRRNNHCHCFRSHRGNRAKHKTIT